MKLSNILLLGVIALSTATSALAEGGYGRSLEAAKNFRANQERIHGKEKIDAKKDNTGSLEKGASKTDISHAQSSDGKSAQTTNL